MKSGIYKITSPTGKIYIGQSVNMVKRIADYKVKAKTLRQPKLKSSFDKHGVDKHVFEIIIFCAIEELNEKEVFYIKQHNSFLSKKGMNLTAGGEGSRGFKHSEASKKIISEKALLRKQDCSGSKNGFYGKKHTPEFAAKIKERATGKNNPRYGVKLSDETKQKISQKLIARNLKLKQEK